LTLVEIERAARGAPLLQVAVDGWWERAVAVQLPAAAKQTDRLLEALSAGDAAVEVLWSGPPIVFVGARFGSVGRPPLREIAARADWTPSGALRVLASGPLGPPVRAELGAVNAWRSVGSLPLAIDVEPAAIERALVDRPDLACCHRPVALEVAHQNAREAWWGIQVSVRRHDGSHEIRVERVAELLRSITTHARNAGS
jgi:hypothetical protein